MKVHLRMKIALVVGCLLTVLEAVSAGCLQVNCDGGRCSSEPILGLKAVGECGGYVEIHLNTFVANCSWRSFMISGYNTHLVFGHGI